MKAHSVSALCEMLIVITQCIEILKEAIRIVRETEPGNLRYHLNVEMKGDQRGESIVFLEEYINLSYGQSFRS